MSEVYIVAASRTAIGSLGKSLKNISAEKLGTNIISDVIKKSKIKPNDVDEVIMGQVLTGDLAKIQRDRHRLTQAYP